MLDFVGQEEGAGYEEAQASRERMGSELPYLDKSYFPVSVLCKKIIMSSALQTFLATQTTVSLQELTDQGLTSIMKYSVSQTVILP